MLNAIGRELPEYVDGYGRVISFAGAFATQPTTSRMNRATCASIDRSAWDSNGGRRCAAHRPSMLGS